MLKRKIISISLILQKVLFANSTSGMWSENGSVLDIEDSFGESGYDLAMSLDGTVVAVGPLFSDEDGKNSFVRVFEYKESSWIRRGEDLFGRAIYDLYGISVALSRDGSVVAVGAPLGDVNGRDDGYVEIFEYEGGSWISKGEIVGRASGDLSGSAIALSADGSCIAIGSPGGNENGQESGEVRIFEYEKKSWNGKGQILFGEAAGDFSGSSIAFSADGNVIAISALSSDKNDGTSGYVRIFEYDKLPWVQRGEKFVGKRSDGVSGIPLAISADGNVIAIHAKDDGIFNTIKTFQYNRQNKEWTPKFANLDVGLARGIRLSLSADGNKLLLTHTEVKDTVSVFQYKKEWEWENVFQAETSTRIVAKLSGDGKTVALASKHYGARVYDYRLPPSLPPSLPLSPSLPPSLPPSETSRSIGDANIATKECTGDNQFCYQAEHKLSKAPTEIMHVSLKSKGCEENINNKAITVSQSQVPEEKGSFILDITLHADKLQDSNTFTLEDNKTGTIKFCTIVAIRKEVQEKVYDIYSRRFEYLVNFDLKGNFITTFQTIDDGAENVDADIETFSVKACICESDGICTNNPADIIQNTYIQICLKPSDKRVIISNFKMNFESVSSLLNYPVIDSGVGSSWIVVDKDLTSVVEIDPNFLFIRTYAIYDLFQMGSKNEVRVSGNVIFSFIDESRRASTISSFALSLPIATNAVEAEGCIGKVPKKMIDLFFE